MDNYYSVKEYNDMKRSLEKRIKLLEKEVARLNAKLKNVAE